MNVRLGEAIKYLRFQDKVGIREQAKNIGLSPATLSRIERGEGCDIPSLLKVLGWLTAK